MFAILALAGLMGGCIVGPQNPAATQPSTVIDPDSAKPEYWLDQPAVATIESRDFDKLWQAADQTARAYGFRIDRTDYRAGLISTEPLVSKQVFEFWKPDIDTSDDLAKSTMATIRRTIHFEFLRREDGTFALTPKVLIERQAQVERRVTMASQYTTVFSGPASLEGMRDEYGRHLKSSYWYAIGRDSALERKLADSVRQKL